MPTRSTGLRRCHSALLFLISSTNWLRLTRICICLVHTTLNAFTVNLFHTWISLRNTTTWLQTTIFEKKKLSARELETEIGKLQQESGYPYIVNIDTANNQNPIDGRIVMSNLCSEILQVQTPSRVNNKQEYEELGRDISCNLGSTNIVNLMAAKNFGHSVETMVRALTFVTDHSEVDVVPSIQHGNDLGHTIALGAMGLHSYFAKNHMEYGSPESIDFTNIYFLLLNYWTLKLLTRLLRNATKHSTILTRVNMLTAHTSINTSSKTMSSSLSSIRLRPFSMALQFQLKRIGKISRKPL